MYKNLILTGMMGVGKSTIGSLLSKKLNMNFIDLDKSIEKEESLSIKNIFKEKGEKYFRALEEKIFLEKFKEPNSVIALGGGSFISLKIRNLVLKNCKSFWLDLDIRTLSSRLSNSIKRPLLSGNNIEENLYKIYKDRKDLYGLADFKIDCNNIDRTVIIKKITKLYASK